jgi:multiple sugar transport system permease protein
MANPNPLLRTTPVVYLPLTVLALIYLVPLVRLNATSLQPREQVGKVPPEWLPRREFLELNGESVPVTPPQKIGSPKLLVTLLEGAEQGKNVLVDPSDFVDGKVRRKVQVADRLEERFLNAQLKQNVPAHYVHVQEWFLSKYTGKQPRVFYVDPRKITRRVEPLFGNYPESIRALTAGEKDKTRPLGELLGKSTFPWSSKGDKSHTITFLTYLSNSLVVALLGLVGTVMSSALVAYGLSRIRWKGRDALFTFTLATMMVPFPVLMIPLYSVFRELGWIGTLLPLWVPAYFGAAFNIFLLRQFFMTIPAELSDAARIDGCTEWGIFWRVVLPLAKPALAVVALFHFLFAWNDFLGPLIFLTEPETFTMALGLQQYQSQHGGSEWHLLMGASVLLVVPIVILFFFAQKTFIQGISTTGMGGR